MGVKHRLQRLERQAAPAKPRACPGCGWYEGKPMEFAVTSREAGDPGDPKPSDFCATCGRQYVFHIKFDKCG